MDKLADMAATKVFNFLISGNFDGEGSGGLLGKLPFFHDGGTVPGPIGQERLIMAKAGETVSPIGRRGKGSSGNGYSTANISISLDSRQIARAVEQPLADRIRIKGGVKM